MPSAVVKKYFEAVGRRKTSTARVRFTPGGKGDFTVNNKPFKTYFFSDVLRQMAREPLAGQPAKARPNISVRVKGGGMHSQAMAVSHGLARALILAEPDKRVALKVAGLLKRDSRMKERRKFGLKKARKAPQWSKR